MESACVAGAPQSQAADSQVKVILNKLNGEVLELYVDPCMALLDLKQRVDEQWQVPTACQLFSCGGNLIADHVVKSEGVQRPTMIGDCLLAGETDVSLTLTLSNEQVYQFLAGSDPELVHAALQTIGRMSHIDYERSIMAVKDVLDRHSFSRSREVHLAAAETLAKIAKSDDWQAIATLNSLVHSAVRTDSGNLLLYPCEGWDADTFLAAIPKPGRSAYLSFMDNDKVKKVFDQRHFMLAAVKKDPLILEHASDAVKADKELVLRAVQRNWRALQHASYELQADQDVIAVAYVRCSLLL
mmetsp:Transcript_159171/g.281083  ORF Transcript_159171/g.281083 Transcript_159171/m.281083 type:complete len:299 (-) Transcript_159171:262-1158(-)